VPSLPLSYGILKDGLPSIPAQKSIASPISPMAADYSSISQHLLKAFSARLCRNNNHPMNCNILNNKSKRAQSRARLTQRRWKGHKNRNEMKMELCSAHG
jgi:hypothetical protein